MRLATLLNATWDATSQLICAREGGKNLDYLDWYSKQFFAAERFGSFLGVDGDIATREEAFHIPLKTFDTASKYDKTEIGFKRIGNSNGI